MKKDTENISDKNQAAPCNIDGVVVSSSTKIRLIDELFQKPNNGKLTDKDNLSVKSGVKKLNELKAKIKNEILANRD